MEESPYAGVSRFSFLPQQEKNEGKGRKQEERYPFRSLSHSLSIVMFPFLLNETE